MSKPDVDIGSNGGRAAPDVPDFDMIRPVGSGGFGEVWLATNRTTKRLRAVKVIPLHTAGQADPAAREISSITRLEANSRCRHPNLLQIHHVGKTATHLFYVMDPADDVSGDPASDKPDYRPATLQTRLEGEKGDKSNLPEGGSGSCAQNGHVPLAPLEPEACLHFAQQLLAGLAMLHSAGMVHRDVKPANCLFVGGQLKLADFGLLTEAHPMVSRMGTQKYMPPDGRMDMRADVYAAGLVIYEMVSGLPVDEFPRLGPAAQRIRDNPTLTALIQLVLHACERESEKRPADAVAMLAELNAPATMIARPRRRVAFAACAAVISAALAIGVWTFREKSEVPVGGEPSHRAVVSFVTVPFEAHIYLDGELLSDPVTKKPYTTPCTVESLEARKRVVAFECAGHPRWVEGEFDLAQTQQIVSRMP